MARVARTVAALPIIGSVVAAVALTGVAVFTVADSGCPTPGHYVEVSGELHLVDGCLSPGELTGTPNTGPSSGDASGTQQQSRP
jgi:hypothetical protein